MTFAGDHPLYEGYAAHCSRLNGEDPRALFPCYEANVRRLLPTDRQAPVLDFGCGMGQFLLYLKDCGYAGAEGIDISASQIECCRRWGLMNAQHVTDSTAFLAERPDRYQAIFANDVIEHIPKAELLPLLAALRRALVPGGLFVMRVPNAAAPIGTWTRYCDLTHEMAFDERSARHALELAGLADVHVVAERTHYRRRLLGLAFEGVRSAFYRAVKGVYFLQSPGAVLPTVFTANLLAVGRRP